MSTYPRITEIPTVADLCWYSDEDCRDHADTLGEWIRTYMRNKPEPRAGRLIYVADKDRPAAVYFLPRYEDVIDNIANAAGDHAFEDCADGYPEIADEATAKAELEAALDAWAEKHLPAPTWWLCENVREYVITQADIDEALGAPPPHGG